MRAYVLLTLIAGVLTETLAMPLCNGAAFYQTMPCYYRAEPSPMRQRLMYVQYMHPAPARVRAVNGGVSTYISADAIGSGAGVGGYIKESKQGYPYEDTDKLVEPQQSQEPGAVSIAESYPPGPFEDSATEHIAEDPVYNALPDVATYDGVNTIPVEGDNERKGKAPNEFNGQPENDETTHPNDFTERSIAATQQPLEAYSPTIAPSTTLSPLPVVAASYIPPRKRIRVELEPPSAESDEGPFESVGPKIARPPPQSNLPARPNDQPQRKPSSIPNGAFFPINFGEVPGGAIAIANSYSTGEGGAATSHATAYGSPASGRNYYRKRTI